MPSYMSQGIVHGADAAYSVASGVQRLKELLRLEGEVSLKSLKFHKLTYGGYIMRLSCAPLERGKADTISGVFSIGNTPVNVRIAPSGAEFVEDNCLMVNAPETYMSYDARQNNAPLHYDPSDRAWEFEVGAIPNDMPTPNQTMAISTVLELINTVVSAHIRNVLHSPFGEVVAAVNYKNVPAIPAEILFREVKAVRMVIEKAVKRGPTTFVYTANSLKLRSGEVIDCGTAVGCSNEENPNMV